MTHTHYKGTGNIHSFRGLLAHGGQDKIRIQGPVGAVAWRIGKFEMMTQSPATTNSESIVKIYRESQSSVDGTVNFTDTELLGAGYYIDNSSSTAPVTSVIIFDNTPFSRNIYVTHHNAAGTGISCNYYIELEEVKLSKAGMAQLAVAAARRTID